MKANRALCARVIAVRQFLNSPVLRRSLTLFRLRLHFTTICVNGGTYACR